MRLRSGRAGSASHPRASGWWRRADPASSWWCPPTSLWPVGVPVVNRLQAEISTTDRELAKLGREAMTERLDRLQARGTERAVGFERGLGW